MIGRLKRKNIIATLCLILGAVSPAVAKVKNQNLQQDLWYGNALYYFYLQQPLQSLTRLAIDEQRLEQQAKPQTLDALLLETALKLDYGMALSAKGLMEQQAVSEKLKKTDQLWLYLADVFYQKQLFGIAQEALNKIAKPKALSDYPQWLYLNAQLALKKQNLDAAEIYFNQLDKDSIYRYYIRYNIAIYQYRQQQADSALTQIDHLLEKLQKPANSEQQQLHERLLISAAYICFYADDIDRASHYFGELNVHSLFVDEALLGFGKVAAEKQQFAMAQQLWQKVQAYPLLSKRKIAAELALAELYEKQKKNAEALAAYEEAENLTEQHLTQIQQLQNHYNTETLAQLFHHAKNNDTDLQHLLKEHVFLLDLLTDETFVAQVENLNDLNTIKQQLQYWQQQMPVIDDIVTSKLSAFAQKSALAREKKQAYQADELASSLAAFTEKLHTIEAQKQVFALNNSDENVQQEAVTDIEQLLPRLQDDPFYDEYVESLRRIKGVMLWNAYQHYHGRLWQAKRQLQLLQRALLQNQMLDNTLEQALNDNQQMLGIQHNVIQQKALIEQRLQAVDVLYDKARRLLKQHFDSTLESERKKSLDYLKQARIAVARMSELFLDEEYEP